MNGLKLIPCDALVGLPRVPIEGIRPTVDDLLSEMSRLRFHAAVVRHRSCMDNGPCFGNAALMEDIAGHPELIPAWVVTPDGCGPEFNVYATVHQMSRAGVRVAWIFPKEHLYSVRPWCSGPLYGALQAARVPLLVDYEQIEADDINEVCSAFPELRLILFNVPRLGRNRLLYPLLQHHHNLMLCFSPSLSFHEGYTDLCNRFGIRRWVFGAGYPDAEGGAAVSGLMYSGLSEQAIRAVAHENIERLLAEVRYD